MRPVPKGSGIILGSRRDTDRSTWADRDSRQCQTPCMAASALVSSPAGYTKLMIGQPLANACARSAGSGSTTTGSVTASSNGRSLIESE